LAENVEKPYRISMAAVWASQGLHPYLAIPQGRIRVAEGLAPGRDAAPASNEVACDGLNVIGGNSYDAKAGPPL